MLSSDEFEIVEQTCSQCRGSKKITVTVGKESNSVTCPTCNGSGKEKVKVKK